MDWYAAHYHDDPSTDNIFGREDLRERRTGLLHDFLRRGGALRDFAPPGPRSGPALVLRPPVPVA